LELGAVSGFVLPRAVTYPLDEEFWIQLSSPQLLGEASHPTIALHFGDPDHAGSSSPGAPRSASPQRHQPTLGLRTRQWRLLIADERSQPITTSSGDCPSQEGS